MTLHEKILGSLLGTAIGDSMGAPTETRTAEMIRERFNGRVTTLLDAPQDTFARGAKAGNVTDDFSLTYYLADAALKDGLTADSVQKAYIAWSQNAYYFQRFAGPTTRAALQKLLGQGVQDPYEYLACDNAKATNGAAMKVSPAALFHPGDIESAVRDALLICKPTHNNTLSISGACSVAAAIAIALTADATPHSVVDAGLRGAEMGAKLAKGCAKPVAGPSVIKRIEMAVELADIYHDPDEAVQEIADRIGTGLSISEAVPAAFGFLVACKGNAMDTIIAAVNAGGDTDTVAAIAGSMAGALAGSPAFPCAMANQIENVSGFPIRLLASKIAAKVEALAP